jgi:flagellar hook protein FlgE
MGFSASLSGLFANQQKLAVIGNNLANLNTVAFKASEVHFQDLVSQSVGGSGINTMQIGLGVTTGSIVQNLRQGGIERTGVATHVAIQGGGYFVVGEAGNRSYTRAGDFNFDADGTLVTSERLPVQGYTTFDPITGEILTAQTGNIRVPPGILRPPLSTSAFTTTSNLSADAVVGQIVNSSVQVFDALGASHVLTITYTNTAPGAWDYDITVPGEDVTGGTAGTPSSIANGSLSFDASGVLDQVDGGAAADVTITGPTWANGALPNDITWDLEDTTGAFTLSGYAAPSATSSITQNGYAAGTVDALININALGEIVVTFGGGRSEVLGALALASFNNPQGLLKLGNNRFGETDSAGLPNIGLAGLAGRGTVFGSALEQSNVDIATEFTQMILAQRGYQANSKSITVADELLLETLNLKR